MTICYMILGADNVGKTTLIDKTVEKLIDQDKSTLVKHFSAPKDKNKPYDQYWDFLEEVDFDDFDYVLMDRGFPETYFYEEYRANNKTEYSALNDLFNEFSLKFNGFYTKIIHRDWEDIKPFHIREIESGYARFDCNETLDIEIREAEHRAYYQFMTKFSVDFPSVELLYHNTLGYELIEDEDIRKKDRIKTSKLS